MGSLRPALNFSFVACPDLGRRKRRGRAGRGGGHHKEDHSKVGRQQVPSGKVPVGREAGLCPQDEIPPTSDKKTTRWHPNHQRQEDHEMGLRFPMDPSDLLTLSFTRVPGEGMGPTTSAWSPPGNGPETD